MYLGKDGGIEYGKEMIRLLTVFILSLGLLTPPAQPANASDGTLLIAPDNLSGYNRNLFKHWIDADKDGCDTRAEVLIEEAIVKPKIGPKCKLTGGKWFSAYDGKSITNASQLDVDHLIPLAEAWRSGAWKWTNLERQNFANDLASSEALIAVTASTNRSKGDKDPSLWMPTKDKCAYADNWISIKTKYSLSIDLNESVKLHTLVSECGIQLAEIPTPISVPTESPQQTPTSSPSSASTQTESKAVTPGAFCSTAGAFGNSKSGVTYTCKTSATETRNRWRL
jgi:hypothetical protein